MAKAYIHPNAICESSNVGEDSRVWAFSHILPGAIIGRDCNICESVFIENDVSIGDRVTIKNGVQVWDGVSLEDDVFIGPNVTFTNDPFPRSRVHNKEFPRTLVQAGASIGANATILPGITIGSGAMVGAGSVITKSVPNNAIIYGNPGRVHGYVGMDKPNSSRLDLKKVLPGGAMLIELKNVMDVRGNLLSVEFNNDLPFAPKRFFVVYDVPSEDIRGEHAHRTCKQVLTILKGSVTVLVDDGESREQVSLSDPSIALYLPPMVWGAQFEFSRDAILGVFASEPYDPNEYVRSYEEFQTLTKNLS